MKKHLENALMVRALSKQDLEENLLGLKSDIYKTILVAS